MSAELSVTTTVSLRTATGHPVSTTRTVKLTANYSFYREYEVTSTLTQLALFDAAGAGEGGRFDGLVGIAFENASDEDVDLTLTLDDVGGGAANNALYIRLKKGDIKFFQTTEWEAVLNGADPPTAKTGTLAEAWKRIYVGVKTAGETGRLNVYAVHNTVSD